MPRIMRVIRKRFTEGTEVLDSEIKETFLFGRGCLGTAIELRTQEDWKRLWSQWRGVVMPKVHEHRPGTRPLACYVVGKIPPRPVVQLPPLDNGGTGGCTYPPGTARASGTTTTPNRSCWTRPRTSTRWR